MGNTLYLECFSGISGDMTVGALLDLGADREKLVRELKTLPLEGFEIKINRVKKSGLAICDFDVVVDEKHENHDHDMEYLFGHKHGHQHEHHHEYHHEHCHEHQHEHRGLKEVLDIIEKSGISERAKNTATVIFHVLAEAEAKAHGESIETVHFHEVGAVDSIVDIVAVAICLDDLDINEVIVKELYEGSGTIRCQHGILPIPVPATLNIITAHEIPLHITHTEAELVTPTGAAIVAAIRTKKELPEQYKVLKIGMGAGKREYERSSILRAMLIEDVKTSKTETDMIYKLETNIDDCTGEILGYVMTRLFEAGARDVHYTPVYMKKNRPAYQLNVICSEDMVEQLEEIIFAETSTIGIRRTKTERRILPRRIEMVETSLGEIKVKICEGTGFVKVTPEYESVKAICEQQQLPFRETLEQMTIESKKVLGI